MQSLEDNNELSYSTVPWHCIGLRLFSYKLVSLWVFTNSSRMWVLASCTAAGGHGFALVAWLPPLVLWSPQAGVQLQFVSWETAPSSGPFWVNRCFPSWWQGSGNILSDISGQTPVIPATCISKWSQCLSRHHMYCRHCMLMAYGKHWNTVDPEVLGVPWDCQLVC